MAIYGAEVEKCQDSKIRLYNRRHKISLVGQSYALFYEAFISVWIRNYPKNEISTPAATAEPITPEMLLAIQYCKRGSLNRISMLSHWLHGLP